MVPGRSLRERGHVSVASARHQWDDGRRRLAEEGLETARSRHLAVLIDAVTDELRRRLGQRYTLADLAAAYDGAEEWVADVACARRGRSSAPACATRRSSRMRPLRATRRARATTNPEWRSASDETRGPRARPRSQGGEAPARSRLGRARSCSARCSSSASPSAGRRAGPGARGRLRADARLTSFPTPSPRRRRSPLRFRTREIRKNRSTLVRLLSREYPHP